MPVTTPSSAVPHSELPLTLALELATLNLSHVHYHSQISLSPPRQLEVMDPEATKYPAQVRAAQALLARVARRSLYKFVGESGLKEVGCGNRNRFRNAHTTGSLACLGLASHMNNTRHVRAALMRTRVVLCGAG